MIANDILLDAFTRVHDSLHRTLGDITPEVEHGVVEHGVGHNNLYNLLRSTTHMRFGRTAIRCPTNRLHSLQGRSIC
jgi:hypothetical protein